MADFKNEDLRDSSFEHVDLRGSRLFAVDLSGARLHGVAFEGAVLRGVELGNVEISGEIENLTVNGVDVAPLIEAELDRRYPLRSKMRPTDAGGFAEAWDVLERLWGETVERARALPPEQLYARVQDEWSFIDTLRHLVFATDAWVRRAILGEPSPWDPLGLPWEEIEDTRGVPNDRTARPSLETVLALRKERMATVREVISSLTEAGLDAPTVAHDAPGWPPAGSTFTPRRCLRVVLNEEWEHRLFAERDLAVLEAEGS